MIPACVKPALHAMSFGDRDRIVESAGKGRSCGDTQLRRQVLGGTHYVRAPQKLRCMRAASEPVLPDDSDTLRVWSDLSPS
jgi:hypothetical protein